MQSACPRYSRLMVAACHTSPHICPAPAPAAAQFLGAELLNRADRNKLARQEVVREYERFPGDTGSTEVQGAPHAPRLLCCLQTWLQWLHCACECSCAWICSRLCLPVAGCQADAMPGRHHAGSWVLQHPAGCCRSTASASHVRGAAGGATASLAARQPAVRSGAADAQD